MKVKDDPFRDRVRAILKAHGLGAINPLSPAEIDQFASHVLVSLRQPDSIECAVGLLITPDFPLDEYTLLSATIRLVLPTLVTAHLLSLPKPGWAPSIITSIMRDAAPEDKLTGSKAAQSRVGASHG